MSIKKQYRKRKNTHKSRKIKGGADENIISANPEPKGNEPTKSENPIAGPTNSLVASFKESSKATASTVQSGLATILRGPIQNGINNAVKKVVERARGSVEKQEQVEIAEENRQRKTMLTKAMDLLKRRRPLSKETSPEQPVKASSSASSSAPGASATEPGQASSAAPVAEAAAEPTTGEGEAAAEPTTGEGEAALPPAEPVAESAAEPVAVSANTSSTEQATEQAIEQVAEPVAEAPTTNAPVAESTQEEGNKQNIKGGSKLKTGGKRKTVCRKKSKGKKSKRKSMKTKKKHHKRKTGGNFNTTPPTQENINRAAPNAAENHLLHQSTGFVEKKIKQFENKTTKPKQ